MCGRTAIEFEVGFADSELQSYRRDGDTFVVSLVAWNKKTIRFCFADMIFVVDRGAGDISDVCEVKAASPFLDEALRIQYEDVPDDHPYRLFQFLNMDDEPSLEVVAASVEIALA